jgi:hypothetical protein
VGDSFSHYDKVFSAEKDLEALAFHPSFWPLVLELTDGKPALRDGVLIVDDHRNPRQHDRPPRGGTLHCAREDYGRRYGARFEVSGGQIYCDNFVVFIYLDDVLPGDGGLAVLPVRRLQHIALASPLPLPSMAEWYKLQPLSLPQGSHKSQFHRPLHLYGAFGRAARLAGGEAGTGGRDRSGQVVGALHPGSSSWEWEDRQELRADWAADGMKWVGPIAAGGRWVGRAARSSFDISPSTLEPLVSTLGRCMMRAGTSPLCVGRHAGFAD